MLHRASTSGTLELQERGPRAIPGRRHRIFLRGGLVADVETPADVPRIGDLLLRAGKTTPDALALALTIQRRDIQAPAGEVLVRRGLVDQREVDKALHEQRLARLERLFELDDAIISFHPMRPFDRITAHAEPVSACEFLYRRPRRRDRPSAARRRGAPEHPPATARTNALAVLGLGEGASVAEIRKRFRLLAATYHPDRQGSPSDPHQPMGEAEFARLTSAYHVLV